MAQGYAKSAKLGDHGNLDGLTDDDHSFYPKGALGYAEVTANQTSITSETDLTGLSVTVTVGTSRRIRIVGSVMAANAYLTDDNNVFVLRIKESTTGLQQGTAREFSSSNGITIERSIVLESPSSGSHTYKLSLEPSSTTSTSLIASSTRPAFILVEDIGPV